MAVRALLNIRKWLSERRFWCNFTAAVVAITIFGPLTYMALDRTPPFTLSNGHSIPAVITAGGQFQMAWDMRLIRPPCEGSVSIRIVDAQKKITYIVSQHTYLADYGHLNTKEKVIGRPRTMPDAVAAGKATIYVDNSFECNILQKWLNWPIKVSHPPVDTTIIVDEELRRGPQGIQGKKGDKGLGYNE